MNSKLTDFIKNNGTVWKMPFAAALSWEAAKWAGSNHPYLAPLTAILCFQITVSQSLHFAWQRIIGTIVGVAATACIAPYLGVSGWSIGLLVLLGAVIVKRLNLDHALAVQVALSVLLVLYFQSKMPSYPLDRVRDTVVGAVVAVLIHVLLFPPDSIQTAKQKMARFADRLTRHFYQTAEWVQHGCPASQVKIVEDELQTMFQELHQATVETDKANQSLRYNPLASKKRTAMDELTRQMAQLRSSFANLSDMVRIFKKWAESGHFTEEDRRIWADHMNTLGSLVKSWNTMLNDPKQTTFEPTAASLAVKAPSHLANDQYPLALYMNAEQVVQDFQKNVFFNKDA
ncbi:aromatic acid exporter family protein [Paenibacillus sp. VCA1]|uniref:FUSC family protein n=1 Tax=Paenibacillus sp. VCA1 TaxID=3039148 RepID=UPI00287132A5|nr:aromatic acid exporter family protein [Paenibacillus sp. VCA1]MDR9854734.1 aromatic acid exporter family protein [Paenibacillus sp. VCA1]